MAAEIGKPADPHDKTEHMRHVSADQDVGADTADCDVRVPRLDLVEERFDIVLAARIGEILLSHPGRGLDDRHRVARDATVGRDRGDEGDRFYTRGHSGAKHVLAALDVDRAKDPRTLAAADDERAV